MNDVTSFKDSENYNEESGSLAGVVKISGRNTGDCSFRKRSGSDTESVEILLRITQFTPEDIQSGFSKVILTPFRKHIVKAIPEVQISLVVFENTIIN